MEDTIRFTKAKFSLGKMRINRRLKIGSRKDYPSDAIDKMVDELEGMGFYADRIEARANRLSEPHRFIDRIFPGFANGHMFLYYDDGADISDIARDWNHLIDTRVFHNEL